MNRRSEAAREQARELGALVPQSLKLKNPTKVERPELDSLPATKNPEVGQNLNVRLSQARVPQVGPIYGHFQNRLTSLDQTDRCSRPWTDRTIADPNGPPWTDRGSSTYRTVHTHINANGFLCLEDGWEVLKRFRGEVNAKPSMVWKLKKNNQLQWFQSKWHKPQDVFEMGIHINHRTWGLCHLLSIHRTLTPPNHHPN